MKITFKQQTLIYLFGVVKRLYYTLVLGSRKSCTSGLNWSSLQLAAIHEMRKSIMHLILFSVDQGSVSQWHHRDYKHCINLFSTLLQYPDIQQLLFTVSSIFLILSLTHTERHDTCMYKCLFPACFLLVSCSKYSFLFTAQLHCCNQTTLHFFVVGTVLSEII